MKTPEYISGSKINDVINLIDFSNCPLSNKNGLYGGQAGAKDGIIYNGENWMIKYPKSTKNMNNVGISYTTAPLCEYIGSKIYEILNIPTHKVLLGERRGKIVVACLDLENDGGRLIEFRTIKNFENEKLSEKLERDFHSTGSQHFVNIEEVLLHIKENDIINKVDGIQERFWKQLVVDLVIGNADRNNGNWGILRYPNNQDVLAPVFDNGGCFSDKMSDEKYKIALQDPDKMFQMSTNYRSTYGITFEDREKQLNAKQLLDFCLKYENFREIYKDTVCDIVSKKDLISKMVFSIPEEFDSLQVCSYSQKEYIVKLLDIRLDKLFLPFLEKVNDYSKLEIDSNGVVYNDD